MLILDQNQTTKIEGRHDIIPPPSYGQQPIIRRALSQDSGPEKNIVIVTEGQSNRARTKKTNTCSYCEQNRTYKT